MTPEPEPCPQCGAPAVHHPPDDDRYHYVLCTAAIELRCPQEPAWGLTENAAIRRWNATARPKAKGGRRR